MIRRPAASWYFGWNIVAAAAVLTLLTVGMRMSLGPFFLPIIDDLGFTRSELSAVIAIGMLCYGLSMPLAGHLVGRYGTRPVLLLGATIVVASAVGSVTARDIWSFFAWYGIGLSIGLGFTSPVALTPVLTRWFVRQRGMALFFLSTGSMAGIAILTPVLTFAIERWHWQGTLIGFAAIFLALVLPAALWIIRDDPPPHADHLPSARLSRVGAATAATPRRQPLSFAEALATRPFWLIVAGMFACGFSMNLLGTHGVPMLMDHGFDATTGALGIGLIGLVAIFSTLVLGRLADLWPRKYLLATIYGVRGLGFFALLVVGSHWELYGAAMLGGLAWAGSIALSSAILADIYGIRLVGALYGWSYFMHQVGATISAWLGGWAFESFRTHWLAFGLAGGTLLLAAVVALCLPPRGYSLRRPAPVLANRAPV